MQWSILWDYREALLGGLATTLLLSAVSIPCALLIGLALGSFASAAGNLGREFVELYVGPMRNVPIVVKLFFLYFVLGLDSFLSGAITLVLHHSAYIADITRAGYRALPKEQAEAAFATGLTGLQTFRLISIPQVVRIIVPPLTSQFVDVVKNSSVCMLVGIEELTFQSQEIAHVTFRGFESATAVTVLYLLVAATIVMAVAAIGRLTAVR